LTLVAPLAGWVAPLSEVPDAVFADKMLGDGVAIDPVRGELCAPCDGEIIALAKTYHAITIRAENGAEILLHVGLDTVALQGEGFEPIVKEGAHVRRGDLLLRFDLDLLVQRAKSLLTPIVVTNCDRFEVQAVSSGREIAIGEALFEIVAADSKSSSADIAEQRPRVTMEVTVHHAHGIHARPAALIAAALRDRQADARIHLRGRTANARSAVSMMSLGVRMNDVVTLEASGSDAQAAIDALVPLVAGAEVSTPQARKVPAAAPSPKRKADEPIRGVIASRGYALGCVVQLRGTEIEVNEAGQGVKLETEELERARSEVRAQLAALARTASRTAREVIGAHLEFIDDVELLDHARRWIGRGKSAGFSWRSAVRDCAEALRALNDPHMAERIADLLDIETQVLRALSGASVPVAQVLPERAILIADELKPSQLIALDESRIAGICTARGGATSHVAILAASMGVPALAAAGPDVLELADERWVVLDAEAGRLQIVGSDEERRTIEAAMGARREKQQAERKAAQQDCRSADGVRIEVWANLASVADAQYAVTQGAEGCGLLRTEFLFLDRQSPPDEQEQLGQYQAIATALGDRPLTIRTLDIGGDKPVPYLSLPQEPNPALGLRGVRTSLWRPDLLRVQLAAILRVRPARNVRILVPMVTDAAEIRAVHAAIEDVRREMQIDTHVPVGAMIETPASALLANELAHVVDFFSIGTNDLTQYVLAMDREHSELAARIDGLHPAVLKMIAMTAQAGQALNRPVAVCGGSASDPAAVPILLGLGIRELSIVPAMIPQLKALIRTLTLDTCATLARRALQAGSAEEVRALGANMQAEENVQSRETGSSA
jgi:phosphoenolpyruvate-protein phosphotransferase